MATNKPGRPARGEGLRVQATIEPDAEGRRPDTAAYVFSSGGRLLATAPLGDDGVASLKVTRGEEPSGARVLIGPRLDEPDLAELARLGAVERHVRLEPNMPQIELTIQPDHWRCWLLSRCTVRGTLLKRTERDGQPLDLPVCGATVEIYEVDPIWVLIPQLPDDILDRIPDLFDEPLPEPIPDPWPDPFPGPFPPGPGPGPGPGPAPGPTIPPRSKARRAEAADLPPALRMAARSGSRKQLREALILHPDIARPLICRFWPSWVTKTLIGTAQTDDCGHWTFRFFRGCRNPDQPDLYFRATQRWVFGNITIYEPKPVACHTHWDFKCGSEVTLYTTSPFARTCAPCPPIVAGDDWVLVMHVGNLPVSNIQGVTQALAGSTTDANRGLTTSGRPFGGTLRPHLEFDPDLRTRHGIRFYRVSVRRAGTTDPWMVPAGPVHRSYVYDNGGSPVIAPYRLGPEYLDGIPEPFYLIPPAVPPQGIWTIADAVQNMANAHWPSEDLAPHRPTGSDDKSGKFDMRIELFHADGTAVDMAALGIRWLVPRETNLAAPTVIHTDPPAAGVVQPDGSFVMPLHVDNNRCEAELDLPSLNGSAASDNCGVMRYTPPTGSGESVTLAYRALHRNGFATHSFLVQRGTHVLSPPTTSGGAGAFAPSESVVDLLSRGLPAGDPPCKIGAFLEILHVQARAFDGWRTLDEYNDGASLAFTLAPATP